MLIAFADDDLLSAHPGLSLHDAVPKSAPTAALDLRIHQYAESPTWFDGWRTGALRNLAARQLENLDRLDAASCCYSISVEVDDPTDLTHLQLAWAVAAVLADAGSCATLDAYACNWFSGPALAALSPHRPFAIGQEVSLVAETEPAPGFGHPVHTRGMVKFGRPDLITGADRIDDTARILNHLARMLAEGHILVPGQQLRFDGRRTLSVTAYAPDATTPNVNLNNEGLLLLDV